MTNPAIFAGLFISASAALIPASAATAAPLAGPLALRAAAAGEFEQVQYRYPRSAYRSYAYAPRSAYRSYGYYGYGAYPGYGYGSRGCVTGDDSTTSSYPSWMVCHLRYGQYGAGDE